MKRILFITALALALFFQVPAFAEDNTEFLNIGFHKLTDAEPEQQIRNIFQNYQKYSNSKNLSGFLNLHDDSYYSSDGYGKDRLKELVQESWKDYPGVKYRVKIMSVDVDVDNATVIAKERLYGNTDFTVEYVKGYGFIDSESTTIYYLKRFSNEWRITSDFIVNEKNSIRYGLAKYIPMRLDAPALIGPDEDYTAILKLNIPKSYLALISINNEPITYPLQKSTEVFRSLKPTGIQERILHSNDGTKNENAVASIGIAKPNIKDSNINVNIVGIAFLSSWVNVVKHKIETPVQKTETNTEAKADTAGGKK